MHTTESLVNEIKSRLRAEGVDVKVQHAITTTSSYLAFDYGVLKRCRVGDHPGKPKLNYRFEIGSHIEHSVSIEKNFHDHIYLVYRFKADDVERLVDEVMAMRESMIDSYGEDGYLAILDRNRKTAARTPRKQRYLNSKSRRYRHAA